MKKSSIGFVFLMIMSINVFSDDFMDALLHAEFEGNIRVGYQHHEPQSGKQDEFAMGLKLHAQTDAYYGLQAGATLFTSQGNGKEGFEGVQFFAGDNDDYAILGEAYIMGTFANTRFILGRQSFDTPFADSDDIGMVANTFEAFTLVNTDIKDTVLFFSHVQKWSGVDSDVPEKFTDVNADRGMQIFGINYDGIDKTSLSGWFYNLSDEVQISYFEVKYEEETEYFTYGTAVQYAFQDYASGEDSTIYGAAVSLGVKEVGITSTISYNRTNGIAAENFFGGGPFFTNAEHNTLKEAGPEGETVLYTFEWDAASAGIEGFTFVANIDTHKGDLTGAREYDLGIEYVHSDAINFSAVYSDVDDQDESFKNLRIFANYHF